MSERPVSGGDQDGLVSAMRLMATTAQTVTDDQEVLEGDDRALAGVVLTLLMLALVLVIFASGALDDILARIHSLG